MRRTKEGSAIWRVAVHLGVDPEALRQAILTECRPANNRGEGTGTCTLSVRVGSGGISLPVEGPKPYRGNVRGVNVKPPRRTQRKGRHGWEWALWCGWCRRDHYYHRDNTPAMVVATHREKMECDCKPKALDREARA